MPSSETTNQPAQTAAKESPAKPEATQAAATAPEYVLDESSIWVRYHPGQYQESSSNKLKDYKVENGIVSGMDDNEGNLSNGRYARKVKFVATIAK